MVKSPTASSGDAGDMGLIPGLGRSTGKDSDAGRDWGQEEEGDDRG